MSKKKMYEFEIVGEAEEEVVKMDVEMSNDLVDFLVEYAHDNMTTKERDQVLLNWAFNEILKKQIKEEKRNERI